MSFQQHYQLNSCGKYDRDGIQYKLILCFKQNMNRLLRIEQEINNHLSISHTQSHSKTSHSGSFRINFPLWVIKLSTDLIAGKEDTANNQLLLLTLQSSIYIKCTHEL